MTPIASIYCTYYNKNMKQTKKPRGAPKKDNPAAARIELRCTDDEKERWEQAANESDLKLSAWLKQLANANS